MSEKEKGPFKDALDWLGGIAAFVTVIVFGLIAINATWPFIPANILNIMGYVQTWAPLIVVAITGMEFCSGKSTILKFVFLALLIVAVVFQFFPLFWDRVATAVNNF